MISGTTRLLGVIGDPVSHSRSPRMQNAALRAMGVDWAYVPLPVRADELEAALRGLAAVGFVGVNVTVPHKEAVARLVDELRPVAEASGSVNTVVCAAPGRLIGDSTDGPASAAAIASEVGEAYT
ncbi:MAG: shikimate dehydrogenase, partial [Actinomycetota bacterium]